MPPSQFRESRESPVPPYVSWDPSQIQLIKRWQNFAFAKRQMQFAREKEASKDYEFPEFG